MKKKAVFRKVAYFSLSGLTGCESKASANEFINMQRRMKKRKGLLCTNLRFSLKNQLFFARFWSLSCSIYSSIVFLLWRTSCLS